MQTRLSQKYWLASIGLLLLAGCSMSRGNLAHNSSENPESQASQLGDKTASADNSDAPPSQPGVKQPGSATKKLTGWLNNSAPKREAIPLERTDSNSAEDSDESVAETDSSFWKHSDADNAAPDPKLAKSKSSELSPQNPFEQ